MQLLVPCKNIVAGFFVQYMMHERILQDQIRLDWGLNSRRGLARVVSKLSRVKIGSSEITVASPAPKIGRI